MTRDQLPVGTWTLDAAATTITVSVKKLGLFNIPATLDLVSGAIDIADDHRVTNVDITADASSYASKNAKRNEHVLGAEFLDATAHPTIRFEAHQVVSSGASFVSNGSVTIKGKSSPVEVTVTDVDVDDTAGSFTATATVDRFAIGIDAMPSFVIGRDLDITINATALKNS